MAELNMRRVGAVLLFGITAAGIAVMAVSQQAQIPPAVALAELGPTVICTGDWPQTGYGEGALFVQYFASVLTGAIAPPTDCPDSPFIQMVAARDSGAVDAIYTAPLDAAARAVPGSAARYGADLVLLGLIRLECGAKEDCAAERIASLDEAGLATTESMIFCGEDAPPTPAVVAAFADYESLPGIRFACAALDGGLSDQAAWWRAYEMFSGQE